MNFSRNEDAKLIELVAGRREIFDPSNKDYKNIFLRDSIWQKIASQLENKTGENCKKRWRSIRDTWKKLKRDNKLDTGSRTKRIWPLAPYLEFLKYVELEKNTVTKIPQDVDQSVENQEEAEEEKAVVTDSRLPDEDDMDSVSMGEIIVPDMLSMRSNTIQENRMSGSRSERSCDYISISSEQSKQDRDQLITSVIEKQDDEIDLFYRSLALSVKRLPKQLQSQAKLHHLHIVIELENLASTDVNSNDHE